MKKNNRLMFLIFRAIYKSYVYKYGIDISIDSTIGYGLYIDHFGGIVISPKAVIGNNCNISHDVTIGVGGRADQRGAPVLGNAVYIGPGAKLFGNIKIGNFVAIGANSVVNKPFPDFSVLGGIPAKQLSTIGSNDFILNEYIL